MWNGHSNVVEMDSNVKIDNDDNDQTNKNDADNDNEEETLLVLRSWMRELRYVRNAEPPKKRFSRQQQQQYQRCDSETLTSDRISQLNQLREIVMFH